MQKERTCRRAAAAALAICLAGLSLAGCGKKHAGRVMTHEDWEERRAEAGSEKGGGGRSLAEGAEEAGLSLVKECEFVNPSSDGGKFQKVHMAVFRNEGDGPVMIFLHEQAAMPGGGTSRHATGWSVFAVGPGEEGAVFCLSDSVGSEAEAEAVAFEPIEGYARHVVEAKPDVQRTPINGEAEFEWDDSGEALRHTLAYKGAGDAPHLSLLTGVDAVFYKEGSPVYFTRMHMDWHDTPVAMSIECPVPYDSVESYPNFFLEEGE